jgi:hypothetical protein
MGPWVLGLLLAVCCIQALQQQHREQGSKAFIKGTLFANTTVYAAMILTDPMVADVLGRDFHRVPQGVNGSAADNAKWRIQNGKKTASELPFKVEFWYSIHAPGCPHRKNKGNDRGVTMSHYMVWHDFVMQGLKHPTLVSNKDILVMLEDDAVIAVNNVHTILEKELSDMSTEHLFLGWCYGRRYMPMCTHAYAITRSLAIKLVTEFDLCYPHAIDAQLRQMHERGMFKWRKPHPDSLSSLRPGFEDNPNYFTRGIFTQKNGLVSFNHHGFQNNAG